MSQECGRRAYHDPKRNRQLLKCHKRPSNFRWGELRIVERDDHRKRSHAQTSDKASAKNVAVGTTVGGRLHDNADAEEDTGEYDTELSPQCIGEDTVGENTDPGAKLEDGGQETGEGRIIDASDSGGFREIVHRENLPKHSLRCRDIDELHAQLRRREECTHLIVPIDEPSAK